MTPEEIKSILESHRLWLNDEGGTRANLRGANLRDADLRNANLRYADLRNADLSGANLRDADLRDANLRDADLRNADLSDADLRGANLSDADLSHTDLASADLRGADLRGADLRGAYLPTGETYENYIAEVVPQLLLAGERGLEAVRQWGGHSWSNCPIHVAFNVLRASDAPALLRPRIHQFVQLYDAGLIPQPIQMIGETTNG